MSTVNAIDPALSTRLNGTSGGGKASVSQELQDNFMTLLVTQLQNQDPLKPLENTELTSQLAQINTVSGIGTLNDTLSGITAQIDAGQSLQAAELIGKGVLVPGERLLVGAEGVATPFGVELEQAASAVRVEIVGGDGQVLRTLELGAMPAGVRSIGWDGKLESGDLAPASAYSVHVTATDGEATTLGSRTLQYAVVHGISNGREGGVLLDLGGVNDPVPLSAVRQIL